MTININDPWFENLYNIEFEANASKFIEEIKTLFVDKYQREKKIVSLFDKYNIDVGK